MKTALIALLLMAALLTVGVATACARQKLSPQDFVNYIFRQLNALTDHHEANLSACAESPSKCAKAMTENVKRDDTALADLDKLNVPSCLAGLRAHFRQMLVAHGGTSAEYGKVFSEPHASDADMKAHMKKVEESQRRERVELIAVLDRFGMDARSACGESAEDMTLPGSEALR